MVSCTITFFPRIKEIASCRAGAEIPLPPADDFPMLFAVKPDNMDNLAHKLPQFIADEAQPEQFLE